MALYDPKEFPNEVETTTDFTLADVLAWARTKPADEPYDFCYADSCAVAQFGRETGRMHLVGVGDLDDIHPALEAAAANDPTTFGAFADRLEQALAR